MVVQIVHPRSDLLGPAGNQARGYVASVLDQPEQRPVRTVLHHDAVARESCANASAIATLLDCVNQSILARAKRAPVLIASPCDVLCTL